MNRFAPTTFLGFMVNRITQEHFIAAAEGANPTDATARLRETYPSAAYDVLTIYQAAAVMQYLSDAQRWPTVPSRVQPKLADLLAAQRVRTQVGGLPALAKPAPSQPTAGGLSAAQIQQVKTIAQGMPAATQALAARLLAAQTQPRAVAFAAVAPSAAPAKFVAPTVTQSVVTPVAQPMPQAVAPAAPMAPLAARIEVSATPAPNGGTIKEALAAMRAFNSASQPSAYRAEAAVPTPSTPAPRQNFTATLPPPAPSALPASARGVASPTAEPAASAFAVGKVSAISVLKALRTAR